MCDYSESAAPISPRCWMRLPPIYHIHGTELSFASEVKCVRSAFVWSERVISHKTAIFRRVNQEYKWDNHDALEFPDGEIVLLTFLREGQQATVLQLPAAEKPPTSSAENKNAPISGQLVDLILT